MNIVFFDVETQQTFDDVGGRDHIRDLRLSVAVSYSSADGQFHHYTEANIQDLVAELKAADRVVGFNLLRFDYEVLRAYTDEPLHKLDTVDILDQIYRRLGFRVSLDNLAAATWARASRPTVSRRCAGGKKAASRRSWTTASRM